MSNRTQPFSRLDRIPQPGTASPATQRRQEEHKTHIGSLQFLPMTNPPLHQHASFLCIKVSLHIALLNVSHHATTPLSKTNRPTYLLMKLDDHLPQIPHGYPALQKRLGRPSNRRFPSDRARLCIDHRQDQIYSRQPLPASLRRPSVHRRPASSFSTPKHWQNEY
jgi:hypothetical protein